MFSSLSKRDFSKSRFKKAAPIYFVLLLSVIALLGLFLNGVHSNLKQQDLDEVSSATSKFIKERLAAPKRDLFRSTSLNRDLYGLNFIRFVSKNEHLLLTQADGVHVDFSHLVNLDSSTSGSWLYIGGQSGEIWTVVSKQLENGIIIQGGRQGDTYQHLFAEQMSSSMLVGLASIFLLWVPALYSVRRGVEPLLQLERRIEKGILEGHSLMDSDKFADSLEVRQLYGRLNELFLQNKQLISEMQSSLDNVAHDLRTPMTRLRSVAEYALQGDEGEEKLRDALSDCLEEAERVLSMLRIMMSVAEAEAGTMQLEKESMSIQELLEDVMMLYEYVAEDKEISLSYTMIDECHVVADKTRLMQVFSNLVDNAIKYSEEGANVQITQREDMGRVIVEVKDNGMGISESEKDRIWERLYRGDRSRSQKGLGLGLNYVKAVVEAHDGIVQVTSELKKGSVFIVSLPVSA